MTDAERIAELEARVAELEVRAATLDADNAALQQELVRRGVKLSCSRVALARASIAFETARGDLEDAQARLVHSEKMASIGQLAAGIAHELNTPAGAVHSAQDTLQRSTARLAGLLERDGLLAREPKAGALLATIEGTARVIEQGARRVDDTVKRLGAFAMLDAAERRRFDVRDGIADTLAVLGSELGEHVEVEACLGEVPPLLCNPRALNQVFLHLLRNAIAAVGEGGTIRIETAFEAGRVRVTVRDDGVGIDPALIPKLFEPRLTRRDARIGAGIGLAICARVVSEHGGEIAVESSPGAGATFCVRLPLEGHRRDAA